MDREVLMFIQLFHSTIKKQGMPTNSFENRFFPALKGFALCTGDVCTDKAHDQMTFVDSHQSAFGTHGVCATATDDPAFDNECFRSDGATFNPISIG